MVVDVEFLGSEAIENVITPLNFKVGKVIFFGYKEMIELQRKHTDMFLKKYCGVKEIEYIQVSHTKLDAVINVIDSKIRKEYAGGNEVFFDITGGESLVLVAFGIIAAKRSAPMHMYDIKKNVLREYVSDNDAYAKKISQCVDRQFVSMNIERYIEMYGGIINRNMQKDIKWNQSEESAGKMDLLWDIMMKHKSYWNSFSHMLKVLFKCDESFKACVSADEVTAYFRKAPLSDYEDSLNIFRDIMYNLEKGGIIHDVKLDNSSYSFRYDGYEMKYYLWDCGSILEYHTYELYKEQSDDCRIGVHIDWDGVISNENGADVLNEIDVLCLNGYIPTFISCKSGRMSSEKSLHALYELETVAARFGRKYAEKVLVLTENLSDAYQMRADEMNIRIIVE